MRTDRFERVFEKLSALGFNVVPAHPERKHPAGAWKGLAHPGARRVDRSDVEKGLWVLDAFPEAELEPFLFPASNPEFPIAVVDVDDMNWLDRALEIFGETPIRVETKRGIHLYYRSDPGLKITSRSWLFGEKSVDVKSWGAGVMAPGASYLDKSAIYAPDPPLETWDRALLESLPLFDVEAYERAWLENRPKARAVARAQADSSKFPYVVQGDPITTASGLEFMGDVRGDVEIVHENSGDLMRIDQVPIGDKVFALGREDMHASGQVWQGRDGRRLYTDHTLGTVWKVLDADEIAWIESWDREPDPLPSESGLVSDLRALGVEVIELEDEGWISDQIKSEDGLTIIKAPHGTGKTILARELMKDATSAISVANTAALAEHNAERFGIDCYREEEIGPKVSTTINSLPKLEVDEVEVFHVDEADAVHAYLHTGNVRDPVETMRTMLDLLSVSKVGLITSADLSFEDMAWFIDAVRTRIPEKKIRVFIRSPKPGRRKVRLVSLTRAKAEFELAFRKMKPGNFPIALGWTARGDVASAAWGYANRELDVRAFWVSGENSRFDETIARFRGKWTDRITDTADFLDAADVFFFSPALQSGVSLESKVGRVFLLHTKPDFEIETVAQMIMRFRKTDAEITWGVSSFSQKHVRADDLYLDGVSVGLADETDRQITRALPEFQGDFPDMRAVDPEFAWSWRITQRKIRSSYADPIGRAREVIKNHGWDFVEDLETPGWSIGTAKKFNKTKAIGARARDEETVRATVAAEDIDEETARRIDRAHVHFGDDKQKLEKNTIQSFYDLAQVTEEDVRRDLKGKFRKRCRMFAWLLFRAAAEMGGEEGKALAFHDFRRSKGRQPSEYRHILQKADLLFRLHSTVIGRDFGRKDWTDPEDLSATEIRARTMVFIEEHGRVWSELFGTASQPGVVTEPKKAVSWFGSQMKKIGAESQVTGANTSRLYSYHFAHVHGWSKPERDRLLDQYRNGKGQEQWKSMIEKVKSDLDRKAKT